HVMLKDSDLKDIPDSNELAIPKNCNLKQIAVFRKDPLTQKTKFYIDEVVWQQMSESTKAGLVMHEIIYEHFKFLSETNSIKARLFNGLIASSKIKSMTKH